MITWKINWRELRLYVNGVLVISWWIDDKTIWTSVRKPFLERSRESTYNRSGTQKVTGETVLRYAARLGVDLTDLRLAVDQLLTDYGWPPTKEDV